MAKKGMKRPEMTHVKPRNEMPPVPELQGKAKLSGEKANPNPPPPQKRAKTPGKHPQGNSTLNQ